MAFTTILSLLFCFLFLLSEAQSQTCVEQGVFPLEYRGELTCDGDAGGSALWVHGSYITHRLLVPWTENVAGLNVPIPNFIRLEIKTKKGAIVPRKSFVLVDGKKFTYGASPGQTKSFRLYYNVLQVFVKQFETGSCPVDGGQAFDRLASVRGALFSLATVFKVKDCSGGNA